MRKKINLPSREILDSYTDIEYLCYVIAFHAAPTLMGHKASSLITFKNSNRRLKDIWQANQNGIKDYFPLQNYCLCQREGSVVVLFYRPDLLEKCLTNDENSDFLSGYGYQKTMSLEEKIEFLAYRFRHTCPHEVGIFLDYPIHDVKAFTGCKQEQCILTGYWKVYAEEKVALARFRVFDNSKNQIIKNLIAGVSPKKLAFQELL